MKAQKLLSMALSLWTASCIASPTPLVERATQSPAAAQATSPTPTINSTQTVTPPNTEPTAPPSFELIGHSPLLQRGMNAALALYGNYVYVGSRTDGSHPDAGVLVVDVSNPASPQVVYQIGPPEEGLLGQTSRELRIWPEQEILLVMNVACSAVLHDCDQAVMQANLSVYDISGANAAAPKLITAYLLPRTPHEMFLWVDPKVEGRALLYLSTPGQYLYQLLVLDISQAHTGVLQEVSNWGAPPRMATASLHSLSVAVDGRRAYLAHLQDGFMILNTSDLADGAANPQIQLITPPTDWARSLVGAHSAVKFFGKPYALITEEVYGACPWSWVHILDISDEIRPQFVSEYKLVPYNTDEHCAGTAPERYRFTSYSSHNPTLTKNLAFITWHSGGLQAVSIENPLLPTQITQYLPEPLPSVGTEDPALSAGLDKVVLWSYPIIREGLIYVVDIRNGLYILKYHGPFEAEVAGIHFLEGNSNLGEAQAWELP